MKIALAGPNGFIGKRAVAAFEAAGHTVTPWTRDDVTNVIGLQYTLKFGRRAAYPGDPSTWRADAAAKRAQALFDRPTGPYDVLVWCAGKREDNLERNRSTHVDYPLTALVASRTPRVVYLSTGELYGDAPLPYREDGPLAGTSDYATAKREGEQALGTQAHMTVLRLGTVYGPNQTPRMLIPRLVNALRAFDRFPLTTGEQTRDLIHVDDVARAIVMAAERLVDHAPNAPVLAWNAYNIASGDEVRIRDVVERIAHEIAKQGGVTADSVLGLLGWGEIAMRPDEASRYVLDVSRARAELGWTPTTTLAEGIAQL